MSGGSIGCDSCSEAERDRCNVAEIGGRARAATRVENCRGSLRSRATGGRGMERKPGNVVIVQRKTVVAGGHHGGAWKVAYADFVTAMMAFFFFIWLLSVHRRGDPAGARRLFSPTVPIHQSRGGGIGPFDGDSMFIEDVLAYDETGQKGDPEEVDGPMLDQAYSRSRGAARRQWRRDGGRPAAQAYPDPGHRRGLIIEVFDIDRSPLFDGPTPRRTRSSRGWST